MFYGFCLLVFDFLIVLVVGNVGGYSSFVIFYVKVLFLFIGVLIPIVFLVDILIFYWVLSPSFR